MKTSHPDYILTGFQSEEQQNQRLAQRASAYTTTVTVNATAYTVARFSTGCVVRRVSSGRMVAETNKDYSRIIQLANY